MRSWLDVLASRYFSKAHAMDHFQLKTFLSMILHLKVDAILFKDRIHAFVRPFISQVFFTFTILYPPSMRRWVISWYSFSKVSGLKIVVYRKASLILLAAFDKLIFSIWLSVVILRANLTQLFSFGIQDLPVHSYLQYVCISLVIFWLYFFEIRFKSRSL